MKYQSFFEFFVKTNNASMHNIWDKADLDGQVLIKRGILDWFGWPVLTVVSTLSLPPSPWFVRQTQISQTFQGQLQFSRRKIYLKTWHS